MRSKSSALSRRATNLTPGAYSKQGLMNSDILLPNHDPQTKARDPKDWDALPGEDRYGPNDIYDPTP